MTTNIYSDVESLSVDRRPVSVWSSVCVPAALAFGCVLLTSCQTVTPEHDYMGLSKQQVVDRLGFPTEAGLLSDGPGFEIWKYYQKADSGELEMMDIVFGNSTRNLGRVVTYSLGISPESIVSSEDPDGLTAIRKHIESLPPALRTR